MTVWDDTLPTLAAGDFITDTAVISKILGALHGLTDEWEEYELEWTSSGTAPAIGSGQLLGNWTRAGRLGFFLARITWDSDTTGGTGNWALSVPAEFVNNAVPMLALVRDSSTSAVYPGVGYYNSGSNTIERISFHTSSGTLGPTTATHPITWADNDVLTVVGFGQMV